MPTGYTAKIKDGITFNQFAMDCARAFGACVMLRDEPGGGEAIPDKFEPSDYHIKRLAEAKAALAAHEELTQEQRKKAAAKEWDDAETKRFYYLDEAQELRAKYKAMLRNVEAWNPPSPEHQEMKSFMREQISQSIDFDCNEEYYSKPTPRLTAEAWYAAKRAELVRTVNYHETEHAKEVERAESRTCWIQQLRESLKATTEAAQ